MDGLLKLLVVDDGPHLAVAVAGPEGGDHLYRGLTHVLPVLLFSATNRLIGEVVQSRRRPLLGPSPC